MAFLILLIFILVGIKPSLTMGVSWEEAGVERMRFGGQEEMHLSVVSGEDESEKKEALLLDKFRVLLGLGSLHKQHHGAMELYGSPAPAPSEMEAQAPSPAPVMQPIPLHPRRRRPPHLTVPRHRINGHSEKPRVRRILVAVLVSVGAALVILGVGFVCLVKKYYLRRRRRKRCVRNVSVYSSEGRGKDSVSKDVGGNNSNKVKNDPEFDLFYLNTLSSVLEPQMEVKVSSDSSSGTVEDQNQDGVSTQEIVCVEEQIKQHGDEISRIESRSSGDESFHSLCESNGSNNARLSMSSFCDATEGFSPKLSNTIERQPPPPPPPPPPYAVHSTSLAKLKAKSPTSILPSPGSSSSRSNDILASPKTPIPPKPPSSIPPPPRGPPPLDFASLGKDGAPLPKLKPLHWDKVRATPDRSMVWDKLRSSSFEFDEEMIESLFGYNLKSVFQNDEGTSKTPSPNKHVLEPKRLQNMTILSKALNVTVEQVCDALLQGDGLRLQQLEALAKMEPTKEEETKLSNYKGNINELGSAEKLVKAMLDIPFAFQRIEALLYRATFEDEVVHLRNSFAMLEEACKDLRSSRLFLKLLEAVLKTGNRMNVGTIRGGAKAFKLDALLKLADVKGTDGKTTLLHFVVQEIIRAEGIRMADSIMGKINRNNKSRTSEDKEEDYKKMGLDLVSGLTTELCNVKKTASIDLDVLAMSVSNLSDGMAKLQKLALKDLSKDAPSSRFVGAMKTFMSHGEKNLGDLQEHEARVLRSVKEITEYFHGEVGRDESNLLHIFVIVRDFLAMLDQVCRELRSLKAPKSPNTLAPFH